jgi:hypothetical protein
MSLERRTRAVARARPPGMFWRRIAIVGGGAAFAAAIVVPSLWFVAAAGAFLVGWAFQPEAERYYLEGFTDGLATAPGLEGDGGSIPGVQPGPVDDDAGPTVRRARPRQPADRGSAVDDVIDLASATGTSFPDRPARPRLTPYGDAVPIRSAGPPPPPGSTDLAGLALGNGPFGASTGEEVDASIVPGTLSTNAADEELG